MAVLQSQLDKRSAQFQQNKEEMVIFHLNIMIIIQYMAI